MKIEKIAEGGRRIKVDRRFFGRCLFCGAKIECPANIVPWTWAKTEVVQSWKHEHEAHGFPQMVGFQVSFIEPEPEDEITETSAL